MLIRVLQNRTSQVDEGQPTGQSTWLLMGDHHDTRFMGRRSSCTASIGGAIVYCILPQESFQLRHSLDMILLLAQNLVPHLLACIDLPGLNAKARLGPASPSSLNKSLSLYDPIKSPKMLDIPRRPYSTNSSMARPPSKGDLRQSLTSRRLSQLNTTMEHKVNRRLKDQSVAL